MKRFQLQKRLRAMGKKIPDRRSSEKMSLDLSRFLENKNFKSEEDLNYYVYIP
jgi:hypothetical protein